ncbi:MAG: hypothetical protein V9G08_10325 [Dermatophilaceae bacterium]
MALHPGPFAAFWQLAGLAVIPPNSGPVDDAERRPAVVGILDGASGRLVARWVFHLVES